MGCGLKPVVVLEMYQARITKKDKIKKGNSETFTCQKVHMRNLTYLVPRQKLLVGN